MASGCWTTRPIRGVLVADVHYPALATAFLGGLTVERRSLFTALSSRLYLAATQALGILGEPPKHTASVAPVPIKNGLTFPLGLVLSSNWLFLPEEVPLRLSIDAILCISDALMR